jgi:myo-inositol catabolism protein IolC
LLEQQKAIRDTKVQVESLKEMMFEHRPQFREPFAQQMAKANASEAMRRLDLAAARLEDVIGALRKGLA